MSAERHANLAGRAAMAGLRFYRRFLSPLKPPSCRFTPTCSAYALEAVAEHGVRAQDHDGRMGCARSGLATANVLQGGDAVHHGHHDVQQNQVKVLARQGVQGLLAVCDDSHLVA